MHGGKKGRWSAAEAGDQPEEEGKSGAEDHARDDWKVDCDVLTAMDDVAGKSSEAKGEFSTEEEKSPADGKQAAEEKESTAEFAKGIHKQSVEETGEVQEVNWEMEIREQTEEIAGGREAPK